MASTNLSTSTSLGALIQFHVRHIALLSISRPSSLALQLPVFKLPDPAAKYRYRVGRCVIQAVRGGYYQACDVQVGAKCWAIKAFCPSLLLEYGEMKQKQKTGLLIAYTFYQVARLHLRRRPHYSGTLPRVHIYLGLSYPTRESSTHSSRHTTAVLSSTTRPKLRSSPKGLAILPYFGAPFYTQVTNERINALFYGNEKVIVPPHSR
jgi:hypothetical protein